MRDLASAHLWPSFVVCPASLGPVVGQSHALKQDLSKANLVFVYLLPCICGIKMVSSV